MVDTPQPDHIDLETLLRAAGQSFTDAQKALTPGLDVPVNMMLSNAELELKVAVTSDAQGKMSVRPISSEDVIRGGIDPGILSTLRISFVSSIGEIKAQPQTGGAVKLPVVPALVGRTIEEASTLLKSGGWRFEPHAAGASDVAAVGKETLGRVVKQNPAAAQAADKTKTVVQFWLNLGNLPVKDLDGVGDKLSAGLSKIGITSVGEMSLATVDQVAAALRLSAPRAQILIDMAVLISRLAVAGLRDEIVEVLVKGAGIRSTEQLAKADPTELSRICKEAIASGKVVVPRGFRFTISDVRIWIKTAATFAGK